MASLSTQEELILLRKRARRRLVGAVTLVIMSTLVLWNVVGRIPNRPMKPESVQITAGGLASAPAVKPAPVATASAAVVAQPPAKPVQAPQMATLDNQPVAPVAKKEPVAPVPVPEPALPAVAKSEHKAKAAHADAAKSGLTGEGKPKHAKPAETQVEKPVEHKLKQANPADILNGKVAADEAPAAKAEAPAAGAKGHYVVQLAALSDPAKADALKAKLSANGIAAHFSKVETSKGEVTRVRVGPFASQEEANATLRRLAKAGVTGIVVSR